MAATVLPGQPEPTAELAFPELTVLPALRALKAGLARMELPVRAVRPERRVLKARPALKALRVTEVEPETGNLYAPGAQDLV